MACQTLVRLLTIFSADLKLAVTSAKYDTPWIAKNLLQAAQVLYREKGKL